MSLEFELPLVSLIFLLILNIIYFSKKRVDLPENKLYKIILVCSLLEAFIDTIIHLICSVNTFAVIEATYFPLFNFLNKILSSLFVIIFSCLFAYTIMITYKKTRENPKRLLGTISIINIIFMIIMLFTNIKLIDAGNVTVLIDSLPWKTWASIISTPSGIETSGLLPKYLLKCIRHTNSEDDCSMIVQPFFIFQGSNRVG